MKHTLTIAIGLFLTCTAQCQVDRSDVLFQTIKEKDSLLFDIGFNGCDTDILQDLVSETFTFYHDQGGITESKEAFVESIRNGLCKLPYKALRTLDDASLTVYPLKRNDTLYGAIQNGEHLFYAFESDNQKYLTSIAKFTHVWIIENGEWKLRTVLSFDHQGVEKKNTENGLFIDTPITNNWLKQKGIPAIGIGFIEEGQIAQISVFGEQQADETAPLHTIWNVASLTKPIIALVTLKLADQGLWDLDESVSKYFTDEDLKDDPRYKKLTSKTILSHQTGLPNWRGNSPDGKLTFEFDPGERYQYSGEGYDLLRKALEAKFGKSIEQLAKEVVFEPLGMTNTSFVWSEDYDNKPFAQWHTAEGELHELQKFYEANGADNLLTTIEDYTKFVHYVLHGADLSEGMVQEMAADHVRVSDRKHFGLGWWIDEKINQNNDYALVHGGDDIGVHCIAFILPRSKKGLVVFTNSDNGTDAYMEVINHFLEKDAEGIFNAEMN